MKLIDYLKKEKLTLAEFAGKIGKNAQAIHKYAHFENYPRPETAEKIVTATNAKAIARSSWRASLTDTGASDGGARQPTA